MPRFIEIKMSILQFRGRRGPTAANHCINAPVARTAQKDVEKDKTVNHGELTFVHIRDETLWRVHHEKCDRHFTGGDEGRNSRQQTKRDKKSADGLDPAT